MGEVAAYGCQRNKRSRGISSATKFIDIGVEG